MKKTVHRLFFIWQYEQEEEWLNEMSAKGWQLVDASMFRFVFEEGTPGEYTYRLELLDKRLNNPESRSYINFLQETGIEMVGKCKNWIYLRCKTTDGGFEPSNKTLYHLTHLLKIQDFLLQVRNRLLLLIAASMFVALFLEDLDRTSTTDFLRGFFTGTGLGGVLTSAMVAPFGKRINSRIKRCIKELYTCE